MTYPQRLSPPHDLSAAPTFRMSGHSVVLPFACQHSLFPRSWFRDQQLHYLGCRFRQVTTSRTSQFVLLIVCLFVHWFAYLFVCLKQDTCIGMHIDGGVEQNNIEFQFVGVLFV